MKKQLTMLSAPARAFVTEPHAPATEAEIREFEKTARVQLPADYVKFLRACDGAGTADGSLSDLGSILTDSADYNLPENIYMIGTDGGGTAYCYDFRFDPPPLRGLEMERPSATRTWRYYGTSFDGFLCHLAAETTEPVPTTKPKKAKPPKSDDTVQTIRANPNFPSGFEYNNSPVTAIQFSPDGRYLHAGQVWFDLVENKVVRLLEWTDGIFTSDGRCVQIDTANIELCDIVTGAAITSVPRTSSCRFKVTVSTDRRVLAFEGGTGVEVWDVEKMQLRSQIALTDNLRAIALSADGETLAMAEDIRNSSPPDPITRVTLYDTTTCRPRGTSDHLGSGPCAAFFADGKLLLSSYAAVSLVDQSGQELLNIREPMGAVATCLPLGEDRLVVTTKEGAVTLYDLKGKKLRSLLGPKRCADIAAVMPDGRRLVTASSKHKTLRVWDLS